MYRRWKSSDQPKEEQATGKSIRQRSGPQKRQTGRGSLRQVRRKQQAVRASIGRPVTAQHSGAPLCMEWRFLRLGQYWTPGWGGTPVRREVCLPAARVRCSMRVAYQAADASHPKGAEQARREQGNFAGQVISWQSAGGESFHRNGIPCEGLCRTATILTAG